ncbi:MAG: transposase [Gallionellaceae bacterium]|jgi:putative transposase|nr:transposase [Gallionellaceae bacterium]
MTNYRRSRIDGASYFFTLNLADRSLSLLTEHIALLRSAFEYTRERHPFIVNAIVVLPEHMHAIWTLPDGDNDFALRWRLIKTVFSRGLPHGERRSDSRQNKGERGIWQRRYWEHLIRDEADFAQHVDYIHINPAKHGLVTRVADWPHSSFHRYVQTGVLPINWAGDSSVELDCGERRNFD